MSSFLPFSLTSTYYFRHKLSLLLPPVVTVLYEPRDRKIRRRSQNEFAVLGKEARKMRAFQKDAAIARGFTLSILLEMNLP